MNINTFKHHFFNYISKAEYMTAISIVLGTIVTTLISSYSNYLNDRNNRIRQLNKKPLNNIYVDYITYEEYQRIIDEKNWKPASLRPKQEDKDVFEKEKLLKTVNKWLANQVRKRTLENEVNKESLKKLAEFNNKQIPFEINETYNNNNFQNANFSDNSTEKQNTIKQSTNTISANTESQSHLPPERKISNINLNQSKLHFFFNKISDKDKKIVGKIAGKDIKKDTNIFESLKNIWQTVFFYKKEPTPVKKYYHEYAKKNKNNDKTRKNKDLYINNNASINDNLKQAENSNQEHSGDFLTPTFIIDGDLQEMNKYTKLQKIASDSNTNTVDLKMLAYLEYTIEKCWHDKYKINYRDNPIDATVYATYTQDAKISDIKITNLMNTDNEISNNFIRDITQMLLSCKIGNITNLTKKNYNLWGKIKIKFNANKITK